MSHDYHDASDLQNCRENLESEGFLVVAPDEDSDAVLRLIKWRTPLERSRIVEALTAGDDYNRDLRDPNAGRETEDDPVPADEPTVAELDYEAETGRKAYSSNYCPVCDGDGVLSRKTEDGIEESICPTCEGAGVRS